MRCGHRAIRPPCDAATVRCGHRAIRPPCDAAAMRCGHRAMRPPCDMATMRYGHRAIQPPCTHGRLVVERRIFFSKISRERADGEHRGPMVDPRGPTDASHPRPLRCYPPTPDLALGVHHRHAPKLRSKRGPALLCRGTDAANRRSASFHPPIRSSPRRSPSACPRKSSKIDASGAGLCACAARSAYPAFSVQRPRPCTTRRTQRDAKSARCIT